MIVHGTKRVERRIGYVADFCPVCRCPQAMRLLRIGLASHIYFISIGGGKLVAHLAECLSCGVQTVTDPLRYASVEKRPAADLERLIESTFPNLRTAYAERLALEEDIRKNPHALPADVRMEFVVEPFRLLNPMAEQRFQNSTQMDKQSGIGCLATILIPVLLVWAAHLIGKGDSDMALYVALGAGGVIFLYTMVQLHLAPGRYVRGKMIPILAKALRPLEPSKEELADCLSRCKTAGMKVGGHVKLDTLIPELIRAPLRAD